MALWGVCTFVILFSPNLFLDLEAIGQALPITDWVPRLAREYPIVVEHYGQERADRYLADQLLSYGGVLGFTCLWLIVRIALRHRYPILFLTMDDRKLIAYALLLLLAFVAFVAFSLIRIFFWSSRINVPNSVSAFEYIPFSYKYYLNQVMAGPASAALCIYFLAMTWVDKNSFRGK